MNEKENPTPRQEDGTEDLVTGLDAVLNLQGETQEAIKDLAQQVETLMDRTREMQARMNGIQAEVEDTLDCLTQLTDPPEEVPKEPPQSHLLRDLGVAAILSPLIWNGLAAGVRLMERWTGVLSARGELVMTALISVAWGLMLMVLEPRLEEALRQWEERRRAEVDEEDEMLESFLLDLDRPKKGDRRNK